MDMGSSSGQTCPPSRDTGSTARLLALGSSEHPPTRSTRDIGSKIRRQISAYLGSLSSMSKDLGVKRRLQKSRMEKASKFGAMAATTTVTSKKGSRRVRAFTSGLMAASTLGSG